MLINICVIQLLHKWSPFLITHIVTDDLAEKDRCQLPSIIIHTMDFLLINTIVYNLKVLCLNFFRVTRLSTAICIIWCNQIEEILHKSLEMIDFPPKCSFFFNT